MTALAVAQRLGLSEAAVAAFSGTGAEFAQFFGKSIAEGEAAVADLAPPAPNPPASVTLAATSPTAWNVTWTAPVGGSPATSYKVQYTPQGGSLTTVDVPSGLTYAGTADLGDPGDTVTVFVRAVNAGGQSAGTQSNPVTL
jgi:hypothetical protein